MPTDMNAEEYERRQRIWEVLTYEDLTYTEILETVANEFEVNEKTVEDDIQKVHMWLPELDILRDVQGMSLLAELRENRRRLYQMAETAYEQEEFTDELKIRSEINRSINMERYMADSSLGVKRVSSKAEHDVIFQEQQ
jgi:hypothetical protein